MVEKDRQILMLKENGESLGVQLMSARSQSHQENKDTPTDHDHACDAHHHDQLEQSLRMSQVS